MERMYITNSVQEQLVDKYLADERLPGGEELAKSMSDDLIEPMPNPPRLNVLTLSGSVPDWNMANRSQIYPRRVEPKG